MGTPRWEENQNHGRDQIVLGETRERHRVAVGVHCGVVSEGNLGRQPLYTREQPTSVSTLDLLLLTAGFACGWVMLENARFAVIDWNYRLPLWYGGYRSVLGLHWLRWLWAFVVGLAFDPYVPSRAYGSSRHELATERYTEWIATGGGSGYRPSSR